MLLILLVSGTLFRDRKDCEVYEKEFPSNAIEFLLCHAQYQSRYTLVIFVHLFFVVIRGTFGCPLLTSAMDALEQCLVQSTTK